MITINKEGYFEIYRNNENQDCVGRFMNMTVKDKDKILKDISEKEKILVKKHYKSYTMSIEKHNEVTNKIRLLKDDSKNLSRIIELMKSIKRTEGFDIVYDIIVRNYVFTGNFI